MTEIKKPKLCIKKFVSILLVMCLVMTMPLGLSTQKVYAATDENHFTVSVNEEAKEDVKEEAAEEENVKEEAAEEENVKEEAAEEENVKEEVAEEENVKEEVAEEENVKEEVAEEENVKEEVAEEENVKEEAAEEENVKEEAAEEENVKEEVAEEKNIKEEAESEENVKEVILAEGSLGTAGDSKVTGLDSNKIYKVIVGGETKYVKADGTLSDSEDDVAALTGTEITGLTNGTAYKVEIYNCFTTTNNEDGTVTITGYNTVGGLDVKIPGTIGEKTVTSIGTMAFYQKKLISITIPDSVTSIYESAFANNELATITIPNSVKSIGDMAFYNNKFATLTIPNNVSSIGDSAFNDNKLNTVTILDNVRSIGNNAFNRNQKISTDLTIRGYENTAAHKYATANNHTFEKIGELERVILKEDSLGTAGDSKVTGLDSNKKYKLMVGDETKYVKADGTLSGSEDDVAALTGTEITGLTNGTAYKVELYKEIISVTFDSNGGTSVNKSQVNNDNKVSSPEPPTKEGFKFEGWYKESELTNKFDFENETVTTNITLYAKWIKNVSIALKEISGKINAITEVADSEFGYAVSAAGDLLAVGAPRELLSNKEIDGAVYIYDLNKSKDETGYERKIVMANNDENEDDFGRDVDLISNENGTFLLVGAQNFKKEKGLYTGAAFLYDLSKKEGEDGYETKLIPSDETSNSDEFRRVAYGKYVALNDKYVVVGAYEGGSKGEGAVYVYDRKASNLQASEIKITPTNGQTGSDFGRVLELENDTLVVSAYKETNDTGAVYIYDLTKTSSDEGFEVKLVPNDLEINSAYGKSLAIENDTLVVGAYYDDNEQGSVYVFNISDLSHITQQLKLQSKDIANGDRYGRSVSLSGNNLVVGAYKADIGEKTEAGAAYLYDLSATNVQESEIKFVTDDLQAEDELGRAILVYDNYVFIGAADGDGVSEVKDPGAVYTSNLSIIRDEEVTVTFNNNEGSDIDPIKIIAGNKITLPQAPTKEGYIFGGWYKDSELKNKFDASKDVIIGNTTLYAKWITEESNDGIILEKNITTIENSKTYTINNAEQLKHFESLVNGGQTCEGAIIKLLNDIDISSYDDWTPIGVKESSVFNGEFNGNSHTISGLRIGQKNTANESLQFVGLFGVIGQKGNVHDVTIESDGVYSNYSGPERDLFAGVLAGLNEGTIANCTTSGDIECRASDNIALFCGGLVGSNNSNGVIDHSYATATVQVGNVSGHMCVGGFVGTNKGQITNACATGDTEVGNQLGEWGANVGGFAGINCYDDYEGYKGYIVNSCATGNVTGGELVDAGGFIGKNEYYIGNSFAVGNVTGDACLHVGGFAGVIMHDGVIDNCYSGGETCGWNDYSVGGFEGSNYNSKQNLNYTYYNSDAKQTVEGITVNPARDNDKDVIAKTSVEMKSDTFKDLLNTNRENCTIPEKITFKEWIRNDDRNNGYPELIGVEIPLSKPETPSVTTATARDIEAKAGTIGGTVTDDGGASITERGVLYSTTVKTPTMEASGVTKVVIGLEKGEFSKKISGLSAKTTYYIRAYAVNSAGTAYGEVKTFTTKESDGTVTYEIGGKVSTKNNPVNGATVVLKQGKHEIGRTTTDAKGEYSFTDLRKGVYNLVVTRDEKTVTSLIIIRNENVTKNISLPDTNKDSILEVTGDETPEVVVGGLDEVAESSSEPNVVIKMTVEKKEENTAENAADIKKAAKGNNLDFMDMKVLKITGGTSTAQSEVGKVLEIVIPYDFKNKSNVEVYRYHEGKVNTFTKSVAKPTAPYTDGTYYLDEVNGFIYVYAKKFSTYAIGYKTAGKTITFNANGGTISSTNMFTGTDGKLTTLPAPTRSGYTFDGWYTKLNGGTKITKDTVFTENITIYAHWTYRSSSSSSGGHSSHKYYNISITVKGEGTITPDGGSDHSLRIRKGSDQTFTIKAKKGYEISDVLVDGKSVGSVDKYTLKNIRKAHGIKVIFKEETKEETNKEAVSKVEKPFTDVSKQDWFYDEVLMVHEKGIMSGTSDTKFSPYIGTSRAMIATILYRLENKPSYSKNNPFIDVLENEWYTDGIAWGAEHRIVKGYGEGIFKPDQIVTREELCAILSRYVKYKGLDLKQKSELTEFVDENQIADWAKETVRFTVKVELMHGNAQNQFQPKKQATRAEVATVICNLLRLLKY